MKVEYFREDLMNGKTRSKGGLSPRGTLALFACRKRDSGEIFLLPENFTFQPFCFHLWLEMTRCSLWHCRFKFQGL